VNRNAPGSANELDIPMDGSKIDRPSHGVTFNRPRRRRTRKSKRWWLDYPDNPEGYDPKFQRYVRQMAARNKGGSE
jgi:hypothetical protein